jgi:pimeloyl-ACP methyl ester carboxylesterase
MRLEGMLPGQKSRRFFTIFSNEDTIFIAFPGSHTLGDFLADFRLLKTDVLEGVGMHTGFYQRFEETGFVDAMARLVTKEPRTKQICFTGHSLGAAVATIFALHVLAIKIPREEHQRVRCVTFVQPLVGDVRLANYVRKQQIHDRFAVFVNEFDLVPRVCLLVPWLSQSDYE